MILTWKMAAELYSNRLIGKDLDGSGRGLNEVLHRHFPGGNGEITNKLLSGNES
jgi:hypothetical protein